MISPNPALTPEQILRQTSLAKGWHRITIGGAAIQVTGEALRVALEAAYHPADPEWLNRLSMEQRESYCYICVGGRRVSSCFIL